VTGGGVGRAGGRRWPVRMQTREGDCGFGGGGEVAAKQKTICYE